MLPLSRDGWGKCRLSDASSLWNGCVLLLTTQTLTSMGLMWSERRRVWLHGDVLVCLDGDVLVFLGMYWCVWGRIGVFRCGHIGVFEDVLVCLDGDVLICLRTYWFV